MLTVIHLSASWRPFGLIGLIILHGFLIQASQVSSAEVVIGKSERNLERSAFLESKDDSNRGDKHILEEFGRRKLADFSNNEEKLAEKRQEQSILQSFIGKKMTNGDTEPWKPRPPASEPRGQRCSGSLFEEDAMRGYFQNLGFLTWDPAPDKFLVLLCYPGDVSVRMTCIQNHLLYSGLLNRTLIIPDDALALEVADTNDFRYGFDIDNFRKCYGESTVLTTSEYRNKYDSPVYIDQLFCWTESDESCPIPLDKDKIEKRNFQLKGLAVVALQGLKSVLFSNDFRFHFADLSVQALKDEFLMKYRLAKDKTLLLGDVTHTQIAHSPELYNSGDVPFLRSKECPGFLGIRPRKEIFLAARMFSDLFLGFDFFSMHFLRSRTRDFCDYGDACSFSVPQIADFLRNKMGETNITTLFLATDATHTEMKVFREVAQDVNGHEIKIVRLPNIEIDFNGWAKPLLDLDLLKEKDSNIEKKRNNVNPLLLSALEDVICSFGTIFVGSPLSTRTQEIERVRYGLGTANCEDCCFCDGEPPWDRNDFRLQPFREDNTLWAQ